MYPHPDIVVRLWCIEREGQLRAAEMSRFMRRLKQEQAVSQRLLAYLTVWPQRINQWLMQVGRSASRVLPKRSRVLPKRSEPLPCFPLGYGKCGNASCDAAQNCTSS